MSTKFTENRNLFHTFSRVAIQEGQGVAAAVNKTGHTVTTNDVWSEIGKLPKNTTYFGNANTAFDDLKIVYEANSAEFSKYVKLYENAVLSPVDGSGQDFNKNQAWELLVDGKRVKNFVAPTDVFDDDGQPCNGYTLQLFDKDGTQIPATDGNWAFDYVAGLVIFERGKTPQDMGWASTATDGVVTPITMTAWAYVGEYLSNTLGNLATSETIGTISGNIGTISGNIGTISGNIGIISGDINTINSDIDTLQAEVDTITLVTAPIKTASDETTVTYNGGKTIVGTAVEAAISGAATGDVTVTLEGKDFELLSFYQRYADGQMEIIYPEIAKTAGTDDTTIYTLTADYGEPVSGITSSLVWEINCKVK